MILEEKECDLKNSGNLRIYLIFDGILSDAVDGDYVLFSWIFVDLLYW